MDTVENVFVGLAEAGRWTIEVLGDEIVQDSHTETAALDADYALVVTRGSETAPANLRPTAQFTIDPNLGESPLFVSFDGSTSNDPDGSIVAWVWGYGDGTGDSGLNGTTDHTYTDPGRYTVTLTVTDDQDAIGEESGVIKVYDAARPAVPGDLVATNGDGSVTLDWTDNSEADLDSYRVRRSTSPGPPYQVIASGVTESNFTDVSVVNGTTYYYTVQAVDFGKTNSRRSDEASATPVDAPPASPAGLIATARNATVALDWDDNAEPDLTGYNVYRSDSGLIAPGVTSSDFTDSTVANGTTYCYTVTATDTFGNESELSSEVCATPSAERLLEENSTDGKKYNIRRNRRGSQSFSHDTAGNANWWISKVVVRLSKSTKDPLGNLEVSIGTARNGGALPNSSISIAPSQVTDNSKGNTFMEFEIAFASPVGPLTSGETYYLNFESQDSRGTTRKYYISRSPGNNEYANGTYFKNNKNSKKDAWFQMWGTNNN